jgi:hypothetical protein
MTKHSRRVAAIVLTMAAALAVAQTAQASTIQLAIRSGAATLPPPGNPGWTPVLVVDGTTTVAAAVITNESSLDTNHALGAITWSSTDFDGWNLTITGTGYDYLGLGKMDLNISASRTTASTNTLEIYFSQLDNPWTGLTATFQMDIGGVLAGGTVAYRPALCPANMANFMTPNAGPGTLPGPWGPGSFDPLPWLRTPLLATTPNPYSLTQKISIAPGATAFNGTAELQPVPEPGSMLLLGTGLLAFAARRRFAR